MNFNDLNLRDSINTNPVSANIGQTHGSSDWLWAVFALLLLTDLCLIAFNFRKSKNANANINGTGNNNLGNNGVGNNGVGHSGGNGNYLLHQLAIIILSTAALAYFSMASNLGSTPIRPEFHVVGGGITRTIWYVRYIMWFICAPLLLLMVYLATGFHLRGAFTALFMTCFAVVCGLLGALTRTSYKWGYFALGVAALFYVIGHMWAARNVGFPSPTGRSRGAYRGAIGALSLLALIYPIVWGLCEGSNRISVVGEMIWYGILDLLIFSAFVPYFLWSHRNVSLGSGSGYHSNTMGGNAYSGKTTEAGMGVPATGHGLGNNNNNNAHIAPGVGAHGNVTHGTTGTGVL